MSLLEVKTEEDIYDSFGSNQVEALRDVNFTVERGICCNHGRSLDQERRLC